ncbi:MAG: 30S ribosomal protein S4 [Candidatus Levybacteria bacterium RBG_16_35_11]|nr:MAG: 30S ribosomal protein S4 [Candidatus Levybacteria bacterium RBG_16_35_11]
MARYTGPKHKLARKVGVNLLDKSSQSLQRRLNIPPGVHGRKRKRRLSEFGLQMREKQKAKIAYLLLEKQFKNLVLDVQRKKGDTGELIISALETRLDNLVYRLGFAKSRMMARQLVSHGHVLVNAKKLNIPSYRVSIGDKISVSPKLSKNPQILQSVEERVDNLMPFIKRGKNLSGELIRMPKKEDIQVPFDVKLIIEYYSR